MHQLVGYHRPDTVADAVALLDGTRLAIGGGTTIRHDGGGPPVEVVDLQALGLDAIDPDGDRLRFGATVSLHRLIDVPAVPGLLQRLARVEQPSTLRPLATVGGTIGAADAESVLLAGLLVHDAVVHLADGRAIPLQEVLATGLGATDLVVAVDVAADGQGALAATGRTPADTAIVAAVARATSEGPVVALTGVAPTPILVDPGRTDHLDPPGDFRGSPEYRRHLAAVLVARAIEDLA
ncbi:MAG: FAD binding domain-containing protein [Ilumatobacteraceae bacterium]